MVRVHKHKKACGLLVDWLIKSILHINASFVSIKLFRQLNDIKWRLNQLKRN
jgi:uncharacterized membrane protein YciS (DUF1049 family)